MLRELLSKERVCFDLKAKDKLGVIDELIDILDKDGKLNDKNEFKKAVIKREEEFSTGIGMGVAIPHGKSESVKDPAITFGISKEGIDYESMDGKRAHMFFLISVPENSDNVHLNVLGTISRKLMHESVRNNLLNASSYEDVINAFE
ncbi:PTS sugar transporter subunit IIA [Alkalithermobacter paradoxus]|uniref:PTS system fructose-specific EIIABC component n=1 Tax=Alkalithermobacter paradoxus TaxID=29349 RepID=A0A1V4I9Y8_9FIRM|nr:PTS system fructose-specific EIIABC component [[Clostridium] thermoalcaliphilum]